MDAPDPHAPQPNALPDDATRYCAAADSDATGHRTPPLPADDQDATRYRAAPADPEATGYTPTPTGTHRQIGRRTLPCRFGEYELLEEVARGGMGVVYRARQRIGEGERIVALKMIQAGRLASAEAIERFLQEARAAATLDHPGIVPIYDIGEIEEHHYFTMPLMSGGSLAELMREGPLPPRVAAEVVRQVALAVQYAHEKGIIHRDLKPGNILLADGVAAPSGASGVASVSPDTSGSVATGPAGLCPRVTDFGLARMRESGLSVTGEALGTPSYMPPEQARGQVKAMGPASDVYGLGALLYCLLTGRPPFQSSDPLETMRQVCEEEPVPPRQLNPQVPRDLETVCLKCLEKNLEQRYRSAEALATDLEKWLEGAPISARPPSLPFLLRWWLRENFGAAGWTVAIGVVVGLLCGLVCRVTLLQRFYGPPGSIPYLSMHRVGTIWTEIFVRHQVWIWALTAIVVSFTGLVTAVLVRPKNRGADAAAGSITGLIGGATMFTVSFGWLMVSLTTMPWPGPGVTNDLQLVCEAAFAQPRPDAQRSEKLLQKYPALEQIPVEKRGTAFYSKLREELVGRIPLGIWLGMLFSLIFAMLGGVCQTIAAGALVRCHTRFLAMLLPYVEVAVCTTTLIGLCFFLALSTYFSAKETWLPLGALLLGLASAGAVGALVPSSRLPALLLPSVEVAVSLVALIGVYTYSFLEYSPMFSALALVALLVGLAIAGVTGLLLRHSRLPAILLHVEATLSAALIALNSHHWLLGRGSRNEAWAVTLTAIQLGFTITSALRGWHWSIRLLLHLGWVGSFVLYFVR
jgi:serine/threonine protein kinase